MLLFESSHAIAANVDFKSIYSNPSEACSDYQANKDAANNKDDVANNESIKRNPCANIKSTNDYVEPRFSTKRPRGQ
jgi:hypothetical protein